MFNRWLADAAQACDDATSIGAGPSRRQLLALGALLAGVPEFVLAADYPSRPIRLLVGAPPGGSMDSGARTISQPLSEVLKTPVIVENKPGATGVISSEYVARSPADGYTLLVGTPSPTIIAPQAMPKSTFNPLTDVVAINRLTTAPMAIAVNPALKIDNLKDLVALSKTRPVTIGTPGIGGLSHLVVELASKYTGGSFESVPYKGTGPGITDAMAGHIDGVASDLGPFLPFQQEGKLKVIAITSERRVKFLPEVAVANESYPGYVVENWLGVFAPARTPSAIVEKLNTAFLEITTRDDFKRLADKSANIVSPMKGPGEFQKYAASEYARWGAVLKERGIVIKE